MWKEFFRQKVDTIVRRKVKFDRNIEEKVADVMDILDRDNFVVFTKKLESFRN